MEHDEAAQVFREFVTVIQALRTPGTGCPWDLEQDHRTLRRYLIEECYEVLDAIERADDDSLREELGDVLLQVVLHAQVAADRGAFAITEVVRGITEKMVRRHPHVFGEVRVQDSAEVGRNWERIKAAERLAKNPSAAAVPQVPESLPTLSRAQRLGAASSPQTAAPVDYRAAMYRHLGTLSAEAGAAPTAELEQCFGDLLFSLCQLGSQLGLDAEACLRAANRRCSEQHQPAKEPSS